MKIKDVIKKESTIENEKNSFFIADSNFEFKGLPILKNSLIFYYNNNISVNKVRFGIFQSSNFPSLLLNKMEEDKHGDYIAEKVSNCNFELSTLQSGGLGLWHNDHFDEWTGNYNDYLDRINNSPKLIVDNIEFSTLFYLYNIDTNKLVHFINTKPITLNLGDHSFNLPELSEISYSDSSYTIIPLSKKLSFEHFNLRGIIFLQKDGLNGESNEDFEAKIFDHPKFEKITITKGFSITIINKNQAFIKLLNETSHKIETYKIEKIN